jgi:lipoprotein-releasing system ATP-binding protein
MGMNSGQPKTIVRCVDIHKQFVIDKKSSAILPVLRGIDLSVSPGEIISIVGASGSGKSTLLHILGGLDVPTSGEVFWGDTDIERLSDEARSRLRGTEIGFIFQFHHLLPEFSAVENVMIPLLIQKRTMNEALSRAKELLSRVDLSARLDHKPAELSGGEQQRVAVARALANRPKIIFADEPSGNLDSESSERLHALIWELNQEEGYTFVIVTHNESFAARSSRRLLMKDGRLISQI